jgi:hypothetical protein
VTSGCAGPDGTLSQLFVDPISEVSSKIGTNLKRYKNMPVVKFPKVASLLQSGQNTWLLLLTGQIVRRQKRLKGIQDDTSALWAIRTQSTLWLAARTLQIVLGAFINRTDSQSLIRQFCPRPPQLALCRGSQGARVFLRDFFSTRSVT